MASKVARRLTPVEREFVDLHVVKGYPMYRAFLMAYKTHCANWRLTRREEAVKGMADVYARRVLRKPYIQEYVDELKGRLADRAQESMFLSLDEKRRFLAKVVRTPVDEVDETSPLAQEVKYLPDGSVHVKTPDKQRAIELDARLMGEFNDSVRVQVSEKIVDFTKDLV